jgi:hypothetical protein
VFHAARRVERATKVKNEWRRFCEQAETAKPHTTTVKESRTQGKTITNGLPKDELDHGCFGYLLPDKQPLIGQRIPKASTNELEGVFVVFVFGGSLPSFSTSYYSLFPDLPLLLLNLQEQGAGINSRN